MLPITFFWGRHEKQSHPDLQATCTSSPEAGHVINSAEEKKEDHVFNYHKAKLTYGLLFSDFGDAIREGDGRRLLSLYKLALLIFSCYGHTKYAYVTLLLFNSVDKDCRCTVPSKVRGGKGHEESVLQIVSDLISINAFCKCPQRDGYSGFAKFNSNIISQLDQAQFYHWVRDKLKIWKEI